jgi:hypothetical protein
MGMVVKKVGSEIDAETDVKKVNHRNGCAAENLGSCDADVTEDLIRLRLYLSMRRDFLNYKCRIL